MFIVADLKVSLTHISLASFLWDMANSADPDQTPQNAASVFWGVWSGSPLFAYRIFYQNLKMKNTTQQPLKQKWTGPIDRNWKIHSA